MSQNIGTRLVYTFIKTQSVIYLENDMIDLRSLSRYEGIKFKKNPQKADEKIMYNYFNIYRSRMLQ